MQNKPHRKQWPKQWIGAILLSSMASASANMYIDRAIQTISADVSTNQAITVSSEVPIDNKNNDDYVNTGDGTQFIMTITSNTGIGVCIEARSAGLVHAGDADTLTHYQVMCSDIISETGTPIAFAIFDSDGEGTWLETTHTFYDQSTHCDIVVDEPLDEMYHGNYSSTLNYRIYPGTCTT